MQSFRIESPDELTRLVVDIGNTTTTLAIFVGGAEPLVESVPSALFADSGAMREVLGNLSCKHGTPQAIAICSVVPAAAAAGSALLESLFSVPVLTIGSDLQLLFHLEYGNKNTFGADRLALCAWSRHLFAENPVIAVDIGTAITFDVLDAAGLYRGGLIMPGIDMMAGALHARTAQLPQVRIERPESLLGRSTEECIRSGIFWGAVRQISGLVEAIRSDLVRDSGESTVEVIVTGGNSRIIAPELGPVSLIDELAVLRGSDLLLRMNM
ncbi:type III pantothenate kinase [Chlorobaculum sp. 24CR]|uniref:type III pantothenate kinase n=1 Tax=Chlorobaculum sp. 24CR TaxID=2508878 RepID=UPI00100B8871|nr:type III pantothenate kinase [Chlorobaculum sp. 24CR]RXK81611.1 type III pantothenate kinase [Chlorobaculum sp. 24CR]